MGLITLRGYPDVKLEFTLPRVVSNGPKPNGFIGKDLKRVKIEKKEGKLIILSNNASDDLKELIKYINNSGSQIAIKQILKTSRSLSKIHIKIEEKIVRPSRVLGLHIPHDKNGDILSWNIGLEKGEKTVINGVPAYVKDQRGVYKECTIIIYKGNIKASKKFGGYGRAWEDKKIKLYLEQAIASNFSHESSHNTDSEYIEDYRKVIEGKKSKGITDHKNIYDQEFKVWMEMLYYKTINKK